MLGVGKEITLSKIALNLPAVSEATLASLTSFRGMSRASLISSGNKVREKRSPSSSPARGP